MARKRSLFYGAIQSFLSKKAEGRGQRAEPTPNPSKEGNRRQEAEGKKATETEQVQGNWLFLFLASFWTEVLLRLITYYFKTRINRIIQPTLSPRVVIGFLLGIFLTVGILPVFSKTSVASPISREQLEKIQTLQQSGRYYQACVNLVQALEFDREICQNQDLSEEFDSIAKKIEQQPNPVQIMGIFGNILRGIGRLRLAEEFLERGLDIAQSPQSEAKLSLSLGNTLRALGNRERDRQAASIDDYLPWRCMNLSQVEEIPSSATGLYQQASARYEQAIANLPPSSTTLVQAKLNRLSLALEMGDDDVAQTLVKEQINLDNLPNHQTKIYAQINLAKSLTCWNGRSSTEAVDWELIQNLLEIAVQEAEELQDKRTISYALGNWAGFYEYFAWLAQQPEQPTANNWSKKALELTQDALWYAQLSGAADIAYQWQWQLGRLSEVEENQQDAIAYYKAAIQSLKSIRRDLLTIDSDVQFSFRDNVEPVYRELVDLLLKESSPKSLNQAIQLIDALQLAELENFLRCDLSQLVNNQPELNQKQAAFIYPIILQDRLEVIFKLPEQPLERRSHQINRSTVEKTVKELRQALPRKDSSTIIEKAKQLYKWLIEPLEEALEKNPEVETLVFVLDGNLRNIPMAVLYDEAANQYLLEKNYALAVFPSLQLFDFDPSQEKSQVLAAGISEQRKVENRIFASLQVDAEIQHIAQVLPTQQLLNSQFTSTNLEKKVNSDTFSVVHLATHGNFSSNPEDTFILAYNELLRARDLNNLLRGNKNSEAIELMVLSACKTAEGDKRAALGLAGLAVRAGARSTLATLWQVGDDSTVKLMEQFYNQLKEPGVTKAEALHRAQQALLNDQHYQNPSSWAPYILVGNWR
ncbi:MAG: CHAT domain-containing protein [Symploca sp. SIO1C2]|nr:CHAT domain-containing protein [Symploca sp. SIO1C2]